MTFEELKSWQKARVLAKELNEIFKASCYTNYPELKSQMRRSSGSVMDNIAEGFERNGNKELINFLTISKGSIGELRSQLYRCYDFNLINEPDFKRLKEETIEISKLLQGFISYIQKSEYKGTKFKVNEDTVQYETPFKL